MKYTMTKIAAAFALTVTTLGVQAAVVGPTDMQITAGSFYFGGFTNNVSLTIPLFGANDITDQYNPAGWNLNQGQPLGVLAPGASLSFQFGTAPTNQMNAFFAPSVQVPVYASGTTLLPTANAPAFTGILENGNVSSIDMRSFFVHWDGDVYSQGYVVVKGVGAVGDQLVTNLTMSNCVAGVSCDWTMSWSAFMGGPFTTGHAPTWTLSGTITAVPEASIYGMLLSGLGLVGLVVRRSRQQTKV